MNDIVYICEYYCIKTEVIPEEFNGFYPQTLCSNKTMLWYDEKDLVEGWNRKFWTEGFLMRLYFEVNVI